LHCITTIGTQAGLGIENAITSTLILVLQVGMPTLTMCAPKTSGVTCVAKCGSPSNPMPPLLGPNESIHELIEELPKTSRKIPGVGTWNEKILSPEVKERYEAARDANSILSCTLICLQCDYPVDDGTTDLTAGLMMVPVMHTSMTHWYPAI
jgi:hypothetical protein